MPVMLAADDTLVVSLNTVSAELVASDRIASPDSGTLYLMAGASATGLTVQLKVEGNDWTYDEELDIKAIATGLKFPDDIYIQGKIKKGDTVSLKFRNTTGGDLNVAYKLVVM